ncbi:MAG: YbaK/EbsC family protein [Patescibacteria group bacterium]|nr:YbaK/EbsC family protein [Patescibacteria group bacterium]
MNKKLQKLLDESKKKYEIINHRTTFTAYDVAATLHLKLSQIAKSLLVKTNKPLVHGAKPYALVVVPADKNVDLKKLAKIMSTKDIRVAKVEIPKEGIMKSQFKVKPGSMAAFGSLYKLPVFVDKAVKGQMIFAAGSFEESIKIKAEDFVKIENAQTGSFSVAKKANKKKKK